MKVPFLMGLLTSTLFFCQPSHAQVYPCNGPGEVVVGQTQGGQGIAAMPLCQRVDQQQMASPPAPQWAPRWGAIATDEPHGILGTSGNEISQQAAEEAALANCKAKGGSPCKLEIPYSNGCIAFTVSDSGYNAAADTKIEIASQKGMITCQEAGASNCRTYYTACSPPVRVR